MAPRTKHSASMGGKQKRSKSEMLSRQKSNFLFRLYKKKGIITFDSETLRPLDDFTEVKTQTDARLISSVNSRLVLLFFIIARLQVLREVLLNI